MTDSKSPREFWIKPNRIGRNISNSQDLFTAVDEPPQNPGWLHVIEHSVYEQACKERDRISGLFDEQAKLCHEHCVCLLDVEKERDRLKIREQEELKFSERVCDERDRLRKALEEIYSYVDKLAKLYERYLVDENIK